MEARVGMKFSETPFCTNLFGCFADNEHAHIVYEYAERGDMFTYLGKLNAYEARVLSFQLLSSVRQIHSKGYAHRDISLENIFVQANRFPDTAPAISSSQHSWLSPPFAGPISTNPEPMSADVRKAGIQNCSVVATNTQYDNAADSNSLKQSYTVPTCESAPLLQLQSQISFPSHVYNTYVNKNGIISDKCYLSVRIGDFAQSVRWRSSSNPENLLLCKGVCGKKYYAPPELKSDSLYDPRCVDVFACGVCIFMMFVGCPPWKSTDDDSRYQVMRAHGLGHLLSLWGFQNKIPPDVLHLVEKMVSNNPRKRPNIDECLSHKAFKGFSYHYYPTLNPLSDYLSTWFKSILSHAVNQSDGAQHPNSNSNINNEDETLVRAVRSSLSKKDFSCFFVPPKIIMEVLMELQNKENQSRFNSSKITNELSSSNNQAIQASNDDGEDSDNVDDTDENGGASVPLPYTPQCASTGSRMRFSTCPSSSAVNESNNLNALTQSQTLSHLACSQSVAVGSHPSNGWGISPLTPSSERRDQQQVSSQLVGGVVTPSRVSVSSRTLISLPGSLKRGNLNRSFDPATMQFQNQVIASHSFFHQSGSSRTAYSNMSQISSSANYFQNMNTTNNNFISDGDSIGQHLHHTNDHSSPASPVSSRYHNNNSLNNTMTSNPFGLSNNYPLLQNSGDDLSPKTKFNNNSSSTNNNNGVLSTSAHYDSYFNANNINTTNSSGEMCSPNFHPNSTVNSSMSLNNCSNNNTFAPSPSDPADPYFNNNNNKLSKYQNSSFIPPALGVFSIENTSATTGNGHNISLATSTANSIHAPNHRSNNNNGTADLMTPSGSCGRGMQRKETLKSTASRVTFDHSVLTEERRRSSLKHNNALNLQQINNYSSNNNIGSVNNNSQGFKSQLYLHHLGITDDTTSVDDVALLLTPNAAHVLYQSPSRSNINENLQDKLASGIISNDNSSHAPLNVDEMERSVGCDSPPTSSPLSASPVLYQGSLIAAHLTNNNNNNKELSNFNIEMTSMSLNNNNNSYNSSSYPLHNNKSMNIGLGIPPGNDIYHQNNNISIHNNALSYASGFQSIGHPLLERYFSPNQQSQQNTNNVSSHNQQHISKPVISTPTKSGIYTLPPSSSSFIGMSSNIRATLSTPTLPPVISPSTQPHNININNNSYPLQNSFAKHNGGEMPVDDDIYHPYNNNTSQQHIQYQPSIYPTYNSKPTSPFNPSSNCSASALSPAVQLTPSIAGKNVNYHPSLGSHAPSSNNNNNNNNNTNSAGSASVRGGLNAVHSRTNFSFVNLNDANRK